MSHQNYYLDLCTDTFIVEGDAVLLRMHEKYNIWNSPGGHVDPAEDLNEAALREVWEETGLTVELVGPAGWKKDDTDTYRDLIPPLFVNRHPITSEHEHTSHVFVARSTTREINPQEDASKDAECRWVTLAELEEMHANDERLQPQVYRYAKAALELIHGV